MDAWKVVGAIAALVTALIAAGALIYGIRTFSRARLGNKTAFLAQYFSEYRSVEMGRAVDALWALHDTFKDKEGNVDKEAMAREYVLRSTHDGAQLHLEVRRRVSHFYQQMGFLADEDPELRKLMFEVWGPGDLEIIRDVILPLELRAVPLVRGKPIEHDWPRIDGNGEIIVHTDWPPSKRVVADLYNKALLQESQPNTRFRALPMLILILAVLLAGYVVLSTS